MSENKIRVIFMGTPVFAIPVLRALGAAENVEVIGVYTPPDRPKGRGRAVEISPVKGCAAELGLSVFQPASLRSKETQEELARLRPEVIVIAAYGKLLSPPVLNTPTPRLSQPAPLIAGQVPRPIPSGYGHLGRPAGHGGYSDAGGTKEWTPGQIIAQREYSLSGAETAPCLTNCLFQIGAQLLLDTLGSWVAGQAKARRQDEALSSTTRKFERSDGIADWCVSASELERRSRAFNPWPGLFTKWDGKVLKLLDVLPLPARASTQAGPGVVVPLSIPES